MSDWTHRDFRRGDTVYIKIGPNFTRRYVVLSARSRVIEVRDPETGCDEPRTYDQIAGRTRGGVTDVKSPGDGPWPRYGDYFEELAKSELDGTAWRCCCHYWNPSRWDACQGCQRPGGPGLPYFES